TVPARPAIAAAAMNTFAARARPPADIAVADAAVAAGPAATEPLTPETTPADDIAPVVPAAAEPITALVPSAAPAAIAASRASTAPRTRLRSVGAGVIAPRACARIAFDRDESSLIVPLRS